MDQSTKNRVPIESAMPEPNYEQPPDTLINTAIYEFWSAHIERTPGHRLSVRRMYAYFTCFWSGNKRTFKYTCPEQGLFVRRLRAKYYDIDTVRIGGVTHLVDINLTDIYKWKGPI